jgi:hypothetical protein
MDNKSDRSSNSRKGGHKMENLLQVKMDTLKRIEEAAKRGDSQAVIHNANIIESVERKYRQMENKDAYVSWGIS